MIVEYVCPDDITLKRIGITEEVFWMICELNNQYEEMIYELSQESN